MEKHDFWLLLISVWLLLILTAMVLLASTMVSQSKADNNCLKRPEIVVDLRKGPMI